MFYAQSAFMCFACFSQKRLLAYAAGLYNRDSVCVRVCVRTA